MQSRTHPGWACFTAAWFSGAATMGVYVGAARWFMSADVAHMLWVLVIFGAIALALFIIGARKAQTLWDRKSFDVRWEADQRAIKRWQEAHPGNDLVWPDHADMVVWLMEQHALKST